MIRKRDILDGVKRNGNVVSLRQAIDGPDPNKPAITKLARLIAAYAPHDGSFDLRVPRVHASRYSRVNKECVHALSVSSLCIVTQGAKTVIVGDEVYEYDASRMIVFSVALPVAAQVTRASQSEALSLYKAGPGSAQDCGAGLKSVPSRPATGSGTKCGLPQSGRRKHG
jgi:hypothetical protein